jgi:hypothetical protein
MQELQKHKDAFEDYYTLRNLLAVSRKLGISRQSLGTWKVEFHWDERCADRDHEVDQLTKEVMVPVWVEVKVELVEAFITQIQTAMKAGIVPENSREMVAVSKELRALLGEADKHEVEFTGIEYVLTENKEE